MIDLSNIFWTRLSKIILLVLTLDVVFYGTYDNLGMNLFIAGNLMVIALVGVGLLCVCSNKCPRKITDSADHARVFFFRIIGASFCVLGLVGSSCTVIFKLWPRA